VGIGVVTPERAKNMGFTGPMLRGSGIAWDLRKQQPYDAYAQMDFDVPVGKTGDCYDRYLVRMDEIKQSIRIIDQVLHEMPDGPVMAKLPRLLRPRPGRAFGAVEGPRGVYGTYAISDGTDQPFRMRIHDPSFVHLQLVGPLTKGNLIADTMAVMASLDPVMGGVDK
jgi:NADH-quinone oxidoreductase subunit D